MCVCVFVCVLVGMCVSVYVCCNGLPRIGLIDKMHLTESRRFFATYMTRRYPITQNII